MFEKKIKLREEKKIKNSSELRFHFKIYHQKVIFCTLKITTKFDSVTITLNTRTTFNILNTFTNFGLDPQAHSKVIVATDGRTDRRKLKIRCCSSLK